MTPKAGLDVRPWNFGQYAYPNYPNSKIGTNTYRPLHKLVFSPNLTNTFFQLWLQTHKPFLTVDQIEKLRSLQLTAVL